MSRLLHQGEKRYIGMTVNRRSGGAFAISGATYQVLNNAGTVVESDDAEIAGHDVFMLFDTEKTAGEEGEEEALYSSGKNYRVWFAITITGLPKIIKGSQLVELS